MSYSNVNNFIVIEADNRDPNISFQHHRNRGSLGGVDCVSPYGTPIYAPDDCVVSNIPNNGTGGNTILLAYPDGWRDEMMHLSRFVEPGPKKKGELVGYSGDSGAPGQPHVHWHRIGVWYRDGFGQTNRYNPWHYFSNTTGMEEEMSYIKIVGKAGARRGGTYAVFNTGGTYSAVFIGSGGPKDLVAVTDEAAILALQQRISGLA